MPPRTPPKGTLQKRDFWSRGLQTALIGAFLLAPLLALLIQLSRAPDEEPLAAVTVKPRALGPFIAGLLANPKASEFECSLDEINFHLAQLLPPTRKARTQIAFQSLSLRLEPDGCKASATYLWREREWHIRIHYKTQIKAGRLQLHADSCSLGRINLGSYFLKSLEAPLLKQLPLLKKEVVLMNRLDSLSLEPTRALFKIRASVPWQNP